MYQRKPISCPVSEGSFVGCGAISSLIQMGVVVNKQCHEAKHNSLISVLPQHVARHRAPRKWAPSPQFPTKTDLNLRSATRLALHEACLEAYLYRSCEREAASLSIYRRRRSVRVTAMTVSTLSGRMLLTTSETQNSPSPPISSDNVFALDVAGISTVFLQI